MWKIGLVWLMLTLGAALSGSIANAEEVFEMVQAVRGNNLHLFAPIGREAMREI
jgi:hypothetical protein